MSADGASSRDATDAAVVLQTCPETLEVRDTPAVANPPAAGGRTAAGPADRDRVAAAVGARARAARRAAGLTLDQLARRSAVSRAMLSKVERGEKSPTLGVLIAMARGLGTTSSALIGAVPSDETVTVIRRADRVIFVDPETGFERHLLSPVHADSRVELVLHVIPPGQSSGELPAYAAPTGKYLVVTQGMLTVVLGDSIHMLQDGDAMYFDLRSSYRFSNEGETPCTYLMSSVRHGGA